MLRRNFLQATLATPAVAFPRFALAAEAYPNRAVKLIVSWAAGGGPDVQARRIGLKLGELLGQSIVVENKVGAGGVLGAQFVAQSAPDGYTLLLAANTHLIQKIMQPSLRYDPFADFAPIGTFGASPTVMVVNANSPYQKLEDVIAAAKAAPGKLNYCSGGVGTSAHLAGATLVSLAGMRVTHIPLRGSVEITASLARGDTDFSFPIAATGIPQSRPGGKLRALAVTSAKRLPELPDVPTLHEVLKNDLAIQESWFGFWAPAGTPADAIQKLYAASMQATTDPAVIKALAEGGTSIFTNASPQAFADYIRAENRKWTEIVKLSGISVG